MKTKITLLIAFAIVSLTQILAQTVEVKPNTKDACVYSNQEVVLTESFLINTTTNTRGLSSFVMNFLLPAIPTGTTLVSASFTATSTRKDEGVNANADLYGIPFRILDDALPTDYYSGTFTSGLNAGNGSDWGIMDNMFAISDVSGTTQITTKTTDAAANAQLVSFIKKQYTDGGVNKYAFLRLSLDNLASAVFQRYTFSSANDAINKPTLTLTFANGTAVEIVQGSKLLIYANQLKQIVVEGENIQGGNIQVFTVDGKELSSEKILENMNISSKIFESGNYIVKITNNAGKTHVQKLIVK
jgi:hypothetical protein